MGWNSSYLSHHIEWHLEAHLEDIITRFDIPHTLVADNGQQFIGNKIKDKYTNYLINHALPTPHYAKINKQNGASNKTIFNEYK